MARRPVADKGPLWDEMVREHGLEKHSYAEISTWGFADWSERPPAPPPTPPFPRANLGSMAAVQRTDVPAS